MKKRSQKPRNPDPNVYPPGLDYARAKAIADYYDRRKDEDVVGDTGKSKMNELPVWMEVPPKLVPQVRKLIARYRKSA